MFERRLQTLLIVLAVVCLGLVVRAFSLQVVGRDRWTTEAAKALSDDREVPTVRGRILDVKGRELAVDRPCIDACVHYEAIAATRTLRSLRDEAVERLTKTDKEYAGLTVIEQQQRVNSTVATLIGEASPGALKWARDVARDRLRLRHENYADLPLAERKRLLAAEISAVIADIDTMWHDLATLSNQTDEAMDQLRRTIVRRVETRRRLVWYRKYTDASAVAAKPSWYAALLGGGPADLDQFDVHVSEEREAHVVLPHIDYALRNELDRRRGRYPGLELREGVVRVYPYGALACQTIGRVAKVTATDLEADPRSKERLGHYDSTDEIGREGLEKLLEPQLRGTRGLVSADDRDDDVGADAPTAAGDAPGVDAQPASQARPLNGEARPAAAAPKTDIPAVPGRDVTTTLDVDLQAAVEAAFEHVTFAPGTNLPKAELDMPGAAVVIDLPTGEVRAMVSWPTYDLNKFDDLFPDLVKDQIRRPLSNRAISLAVEPGSTVKPIIGMGAITDGLFGINDTIHCNGYVVIGGHQYKTFGRCWTMSMHNTTHQLFSNPHPTGDLTFPDALQRSCNVFHEELAYRLGLDGVSKWFRAFGLGAPTGTGLPESSGLLPDAWRGPEAERMSTTCLAGIGEAHVAATPIQMANVAATIARNGIKIQPTLRQGERNAPVDLHLNPQAVAEARLGMFEVVNTPAGTGRQAAVAEVSVAAKTGSAQTGPLRIPLRDTANNRLRDPNGRVMYDDIMPGTHDAPNPRAPWYRYTGDTEKKIPAHGWMIGYAPAEHPKIAFAVLVEYGGGGGPAAGSVVQTLLKAAVAQGYMQGGE